jgi:hypothetical protein
MLINKPTAAVLGLLVLWITATALGQQTPAPPSGQSTAPGLLKLTGGDAKRAEDLHQGDETRWRVFVALEGKQGYGCGCGSSWAWTR